MSELKIHVGFCQRFQCLPTIHGCPLQFAFPCLVRASRYRFSVTQNVLHRAAAPIARTIPKVSGQSIGTSVIMNFWFWIELEHQQWNQPYTGWCRQPPLAVIPGHLPWILKGTSKDYLCNKRTIIGVLEQFDLFGRFPDGMHRHTLFERDSYHLLEPEFQELIGFCHLHEIQRGKKESTSGASPLTRPLFYTRYRSRAPDAWMKWQKMRSCHFSFRKTACCRRAVLTRKTYLLSLRSDSNGKGHSAGGYWVFSPCWGKQGKFTVPYTGWS